MRGFIRILLLVLLAGCNLNAPDTTATPAPTPDIPTVAFITPEAGTQAVEGFDLTVDIAARDERGIQRIDLLLNGDIINTAEVDNVPLPVFRVEMNWVTAGVGRHVLSAIAYRADGTASDEQFVTIEVVPRE